MSSAVIQLVDKRIEVTVGPGQGPPGETGPQGLPGQAAFNTSGQSYTNYAANLAAWMTAAGKAGAIYNPSKLSSVWQDAAGTVAGVVGQPVLRIDDLSGNGNHLTLKGGAGVITLQIDPSGRHYLAFPSNASLNQPYSAGRTFNRDSYLAAAFAKTNQDQFPVFGFPSGGPFYIAGLITNHRVRILASIGGVNASIQSPSGSFAPSIAGVVDVQISATGASSWQHGSGHSRPETWAQFDGGKRIAAAAFPNPTSAAAVALGISPQTLTPQNFYGGVWIDSAVPLTTRNEINQWLRYLCGESDLDSLTYDVFIVAGQSNAQGAAAGFGPTPALGRGAYWSPWYTVNRMADPVRMLEDDVSLTGSAWPAFAEAWYVRTGNPVLIIGTAVSGCGLVTAGPDGLWGAAGNLTTRAANQALEALTYLGAQANLKGVIWAGGEQDANALTAGTVTEAAYVTALVDLRNRFRTALDKPTLPMFMISADRRTDGTDDAGYVKLRSAQVTAGTADSGIKLVVPYQNFVGAGLMSDVVHWNQTAQNTVGTTAAGAIATHFGYA